MPFDNRLAFVFSEATIWRQAPAASGVFGLSDSRGWIVVGESDDIRTALLHLVSAAPPDGRLATGFSYELRSAGDRTHRCDQLIAELRPAMRLGVAT